MEYLRGEIGLEDSPNEVVTVIRGDNIFDLAVLASFEGKPTTNEHPPKDVEPLNYATYAVGHVQNVRRGADKDSDKIVADLFFTDPRAISDIEEGKREVSSGYTAQYTLNEDGTFSQIEIRGNHVALVDNGRAGKSVSIKDELPTKIERRTRKMSKPTKTSGFLNIFAKSVRDAKPDEIDELVQDAAETVEKLTAEETAPAPAAKEEVKDCDPAKGGALDALLGAITALTAKIDALSAAKTPDELPAAVEEAAAEQKEDAIDKLLGELETGDDGESPTEQEEAVTVSASALDDDEVSEITADAAIRIIKNARPAIAAIADPKERKRVTDALSASIRKSLNSSYAGVLETTHSTAKKNVRDSGEMSESAIIEAQQAAYDKHNPHKKKEEK
jgi:hypothetical protein